MTFCFAQPTIVWAQQTNIVFSAKCSILIIYASLAEHEMQGSLKFAPIRLVTLPFWGRTCVSPYVCLRDPHANASRIEFFV